MPCWQLWGEARGETLTPYASLQPEVSSFEAYVESMVGWATRARDLGFTAAKLEATFSGPYAHKGLSGPDDWVVEVAREVRAAAGPEMTLMVDAQYAFDTVERALRRRRADRGVRHLLPGDAALDGRPRRLRQAGGGSPVAIAAGEWLSSRHEFAQLIERSAVDVVQPDIGRVGGFTEARRVCDMAGEAGLRVVPHAWKTGISVAAAAHLATVTPHMPFFEFLPAELCESRLRKELTVDELVFDSGRLGIPARPGLGIELNRDAVREFAEAAARVA